MGVWHTGDNEYLRTNIHKVATVPLTREFPCKYCKRVFASKEELFDHRFESHPTHRPILFLHGDELGTTRVLVTRTFNANDIDLRMCDHATINNEKVDVKFVPSQLAQFRTDICRLVLKNDSVQAVYTLDFRIAKDEDLIGIEDQFVRIFNGPRLDIRVIDEFISASSEYRSAISYCDGVCAYLYGVLAKERSPDSTLPYNEYVEKFNISVEKLASYERPLSRTICSLIEFHFNHFLNAWKLAKGKRVGQAAARFAALLENKETLTDIWETTPVSGDSLDASVSDWETEQIIRWITSRKEDLPKYLPEVEILFKGVETRFDHFKLRVLLAEIYALEDDYKKVLLHAKELRNLPGFRRWATSIIRRHS